MESVGSEEHGGPTLRAVAGSLRTQFCWQKGARLLALCPDKQGQPVLAALASIKANGPPIDLEATGRPPLMSK